MSKKLHRDYPHLLFCRNWDLSPKSLLLLGQCEAYMNAIVVICFRSLNNLDLWQQVCTCLSWPISCDLLSFFEQLRFVTTDFVDSNPDMGCDLLSFFEQLRFVTTNFFSWFPNYGCDLLSFFEQLRFVTTSINIINWTHMLWFAFVLWTT